MKKAAASSKSMEEQSQALLEQVAFFDNGEEKDHAPTKAPKPQARAVREKPSPRKSATRSKVQVDDEWEEF